VLQVQILNNSICQNLYGIITDNMMCTSGDNGRGSCYGDSGGPAVVKQPDGTYVQVRSLLLKLVRFAPLEKLHNTQNNVLYLNEKEKLNIKYILYNDI
jgi:hypothetical protein